MADSKVSELTAASSAGSSDLLYIVQSNTSKKITIANLFASAANPTLSGNVTLSGVQSLLAAGVINSTSPITNLTGDGSGGVCSIVAGSTNQIKIVNFVSGTGTYTIYGNIAGNANVVLNNVGDTALMLYNNSKWYVIGGTANVVY